jgi:MFS family permease
MTATSLILIVTSSDYFHLFLSMLFLGFASGIYYPASVSLIAHNFEKRGKALSYNDLALNLGGIMLPIIAGFIILQWGWREIFLIPLILTLIVTSMFIYMRSYSKKVERTGEALFSITRPILLITFAYILINSFYWGVAVFLPTYARFLNFNVVLSSAIASIPFVGGFVGNLIFGNLSDTMGRKKVITMLFIFGAFFVFILSTGSRFLLFPVVLLFGVVTLPCFPIIFAYVSDIAPQDKMGSTLGFVNAIGSFIGSTSPFISGYIIDIAGFKYYVYFNAMLPILALLILRRIR